MRTPSLALRSATAKSLAFKISIGDGIFSARITTDAPLAALTGDKGATMGRCMDRRDTIRAQLAAVRRWTITTAAGVVTTASPAVEGEGGSTVGASMASAGTSPPSGALW